MHKLFKELDGKKSTNTYFSELYFDSYINKYIGKIYDNYYGWCFCEITNTLQWVYLPEYKKENTIKQNIDPNLVFKTNVSNWKFFIVLPDDSYYFVSPLNDYNMYTVYNPKEGKSYNYNPTVILLFLNYYKSGNPEYLGSHIKDIYFN